MKRFYYKYLTVWALITSIANALVEFCFAAKSGFIFIVEHIPELWLLAVLSYFILYVTCMVTLWLGVGALIQKRSEYK